MNLQTIMRSSDWIGHPVSSPYWSADGKSIFYWLKRDGSAENDTHAHVVGPGNKVSDLYRVSIADGSTVKIDAASQLTADGPLVFNRGQSRAAYIRHGDVFVLHLATGHRKQITASGEQKSSPRFSADGDSVHYRSGGDWCAYSCSSGLSIPLAILRTGTDPDSQMHDALRERQMRLYSSLRRIRADQDAINRQQEEYSRADAGIAPRPIWLGERVRLLASEPSPDGRWLIAIIEAERGQGRMAEMTKYVTESGYPERRDGHRYANEEAPQDQTILCVDLKARMIHPVSTESLPGIHEDPLKDLREKRIAALVRAGQHARAAALMAPAKRAIRVVEEDMAFCAGGIVWSQDGSQVAIEMKSVDNKDRWIASIDFEKHQLVPQHRLHDPAWISWGNNEFGWLTDNRTLWFMSEEAGRAHLYEKPVDGPPVQLTSGQFEVGNPKLSHDGQWFYLRSNKAAPYSYDVYRIRAEGGALTRITDIASVDEFNVSPDGTRILVLHSGFYMLPQLAVQNAGGGDYRKLTDTMKPAFSDNPWITPEIVEIPSSHVADVIYAKCYRSTVRSAGCARPAVIFIHGAGYLQNVTKSWPYYYREQLFHNYLVRQGYVVLDMDYRGSRGYGRDWRVAVYRRMGHPELEDLLDGKAWLVENHGVDPHRVGVYGGSYGGFLTLMALLRAPGEFAAGAALRAPSDWGCYTNEFATEMMNTLELDPEAYEACSPIEYAENLQDALLISHGLLDSNVLASDSMRLYQRLIELGKKDFWLTVYPFEGHEFQFDDSWYDQYRRIDELFARFLKDAPPRVECKAT